MSPCHSTLYFYLGLWCGCIVAEIAFRQNSCHCNDGGPCDPENGFCPEGCAPGWTGAGCQIGNLALHNLAYQSSDYTNSSGKVFAAGLAVDGLLPSLFGSDSFCSSTWIYDTISNPWWFVSLGDAYYVVSNITIVNREGDRAFRLQRFYVLLGNHTDGNPSTGSWRVCSYQESQPATISSYSCKNVTVAQRVAVFLNDPKREVEANVLTLCEVYIYGYKYTVCDDQSRFGPGCLLRKCNSSFCKAAGGSCGLYDECLLSQCPQDQHLPPDCWITMPSLNGSATTTTSSCEQVTVNVTSNLQRNMAATSLLLEYAKGTSLKQMPFQNITSNNIKILTFDVSPGEIYTFRLTPLVCDGSRCQRGVSSPTLQAVAASRSFYAVENNSCIYFTVNSSSRSCSLPSSYLVNCTVGDGSKYVFGNSSFACGLEQSLPYTCFVNASMSNGIIEVYSARFPTKDLEYPRSNVLQLAVYIYCEDRIDITFFIEIPPGFVAASSFRLLVANGTGISTLYENEYISYENRTLRINYTVSDSYTFRLEGNFCKYGDCRQLSKEETVGAGSMKCQQASTTTSGNTVDAVIAGATIGTVLLIITIVVTAVFVLRKRLINEPSTNRHESDSKKQVIPVVTGVSGSRMSLEQVYTNLAGLTLAEFIDYNRNEDFISRKFKELPGSETHPTTVAKIAENKCRNRFQNILPYDKNRVILHSNDGISAPYVNASYVDGYERKDQYIATQGPKECTVPDFWNMTWQLNSAVIIMLTNFVEGSKNKCEKYFPFESPDGLRVRETAAHTYDAYRITELKLEKESEARKINHAHFLEWSDHSVPDLCVDVLLFRSKVNSLSQELAAGGPLIVHCSAGAGRTGAYIAIDILLERYNKTAHVDVDSCVLRLRDQRMHMVQTKEQYLFVHRAVLHGMRTSEFIIPADRLKFQCDAVMNTGAQQHHFIQEWEALQQCQPCTDNDFVCGNLLENMPKNRDSAVIARDSARPMLQSRNGSSDYINAVFCKGLRGPQEFLVTQIPLPNTVEDFWSMVLAFQTKCIVLLHPLPTSNETWAPYIPQASSDVDFTSFRVSCARSIIARDMFPVKDLEIIEKETSVAKDPTALRMFCFDAWDVSNDLPDSVPRFLAFIKVVQTWMKHNEQRPVVVHCLNGARHSGLFITALNALDRLLDQGQACAFHTTELARISRPQFIVNEVQYKFLYDVLLRHQEDCTVYANT